MKKLQNIEEVFMKLYEDEDTFMLNLFAGSLISANELINKEVCEHHLRTADKLAEFLSKQPDSEKKAYYEKFVIDAKEIINQSLNDFKEEYKEEE